MNDQLLHHTKNGMKMSAISALLALMKMSLIKAKVGPQVRPSASFISASKGEISGHLILMSCFCDV